MNSVGKIDKEIYRCVSPNIATDEVIITQERIQHILERHPLDYAVIEPFIADALENPNYILKDKREDTALILKHIEHENVRFQMVLKLQTSKVAGGFKNSILSGWIISEDRWNRYLKHKDILYKKE